MKPTFSFLILLSSVVSAWGITIETVPIGDTGNPNDPASARYVGQDLTLFGRVDYPYNIGKYEVTVGQYAEFLNAVARTDTYELYNIGMATDAISAGIARSGVNGNFTYQVIGSPKHPITYVGWGDAIRFANWLHNGQPTGAQDTSTTEDGAYTLNGAVNDATLNVVSRNVNARWFIPSENEWYKAAYYQPAAKGGDADNYWTYPMRTNSVPYSDQPPGTTPDNTRVGNFYQDDRMENGYDDGFAVTGFVDRVNFQNCLTDVGAYTLSPSYYGTFDQGGNVWEWTDVLIYDVYRGVRGGSLYNDETTLRGWSRYYTNPAEGQGSGIGFRVAAIAPEPSASVLAFVASAAVCCLKRPRTLRRKSCCSSLLAVLW